MDNPFKAWARSSRERNAKIQGYTKQGSSSGQPTITTTITMATAAGKSGEEHNDRHTLHPVVYGRRTESMEDLAMASIAADEGKPW